MLDMSGSVTECGVCGQTVPIEEIGPAIKLSVGACRDCQNPNYGDSDVEVEDVYPEARELATEPLGFGGAPRA